MELSAASTSRVRLRNIVCSSVKSKSTDLRPLSGAAHGQAVGAHLARQPQHPLADDVLLDLGGAGVDGASARPEEVVSPVVLAVAGGADAQRQLVRQALEQLAVWPEDLLNQLLVALVHLAVVQLVDRRLGAWPLALLELREQPQAGVAQ